MTKTRHPSDRSQRLKIKNKLVNEEAKKLDREGHVRRKLAIERLKEQETENELQSAPLHQLKHLEG